MEALLRNSFELVALVTTYRHRTAMLRFEIYPMVHVAEPSFYEDVAQRLTKCDVIFYEGVPSKHAASLTRPYRWLARRSRLGLVLQSEALRLESLADRMVRADMPRQEFESRWRSLPALVKVLIALLTAPVALVLFFTETRERIARRLTQSSLPADEGLEPEDSDALEDLVLDARDQHLGGVLLRYFQENHDRDLKAAIVFGAEHVSAIERLLTRRLQYRPIGGHQIPVFSLDPAA